MYYVKPYNVEDKLVIEKLMTENPLALICGSTIDGLPVASHIPLLVEKGQGGEILYLYGHLMKGTDHFQALLANNNVLAVFTGDNHYISANYYKGGQSASTWNYETVHVRGQVEWVDEIMLRNILAKTQDYFEKTVNEDCFFETLADSYVNKHLAAIIGFKINIQSIKATIKMSQDKGAEERKGIVEGLCKWGSESSKIMAEKIKTINKKDK